MAEHPHQQDSIVTGDSSGNSVNNEVITEQARRFLRERDEALARAEAAEAQLARVEKELDLASVEIDEAEHAYHQSVKGELDAEIKAAKLRVATEDLRSKLGVVRHAVRNGDWADLDAMQTTVGDALDELLAGRSTVADVRRTTGPQRWVITALPPAGANPRSERIQGPDVRDTTVVRDDTEQLRRISILILQTEQTEAVREARELLADLLVSRWEADHG